MFCADIKSSNDIFTMRGIDREAVCIVVVRPDQYIAHVLPLNGQFHVVGGAALFCQPRFSQSF
jgi:hypothetical protein